MEHFDFLRSLSPAWIGGPIALILALLAQRSRPRNDGWTYVTPGIMPWILVTVPGMLIVVIMAALVSDIGQTGELPHWRGIAFIGGIVGCLAAGIYAVLRRMRATHLLSLRWNERYVDWHDEWGVRRIQWIGNFIWFSKSWTGYYVLAFADGRRMKIDQHSAGIEDMLEQAITARESVLLDAPDEAFENRNDVESWSVEERVTH